jgi:hypothetical protein
MYGLLTVQIRIQFVSQFDSPDSGPAPTLGQPVWAGIRKGPADRGRPAT